MFKYIENMHPNQDLNYVEVSEHSSPRSCPSSEHLLRQLVEEERHNHLLEIQSINRKIEEYTQTHQGECIKYEQQLNRWQEKVNSYRAKCSRLTQQQQYQSDTVKNLMKKKITLEKEVIRVKEEAEAERQKHEQSKQCICELQHVIKLMEMQNLQLTNEIQRLQQQLAHLSEAMSAHSRAYSRFGDLAEVAQLQHQQQIDIMRGQLQQQLRANTAKMLQDMATLQATTPHIDCPPEHLGGAEEVSREMVELRVLASCVEYGAAYFKVPNQELKLFQAQKIHQYIREVIEVGKSVECELETERQQHQQLRHQYEAGLLMLESQVGRLRKQEGVERGVQFGITTRMDEVVSINTQLKLKNLHLQKILQLVTQLAVFLCRVHQATLSKIPFYHFTQQHFFLQRPTTSQKPLNRLRSTTLKRKALKRKKVASTLPAGMSQELRESIMGRLVGQFLRSRREAPTPNRGVEKAIKQSATCGYCLDQVLVDIVGTELGRNLPRRQWVGLEMREGGKLRGWL